MAWSRQSVPYDMGVTFLNVPTRNQAPTKGNILSPSPSAVTDPWDISEESQTQLVPGDCIECDRNERKDSIPTGYEGKRQSAQTRVLFHLGRWIVLENKDPLCSATLHGTWNLSRKKPD